MAGANGDRNLLFGLLALQTSLIDQGALVAAFHAWTRDKSRAMGQVLVEAGALDDGRRAVLEALVEEHIKRHGGDAEKSLAVVGPLIGPSGAGLEQVEDTELRASLTLLLGELGTEDDPDLTRIYPTDGPTPSGPRFRILRFHDKGGLGEVFVARDEELNREVALKRIQEQHADDPRSRSRFLVEAEITGRLEHPGIVPVYGLGRYDDGRPFYAMRFIQGESLKGWLETPRARSIHPSVPPPLDAICARAMAKKKEDRFAEASGLAEAVRGWMTGQSGSPR